MKKILVVAPPSGCTIDVLGYAAQIAQQYSAELTVFDYYYENLNGVDSAQQVKTLLLKSRSEQLKVMMSRVGINPQSLVVNWVQPLDLQLLTDSTDGHYDLIIKAKHNCSIQTYLPIDWHLLSSTQVPVLMLDEQPSTPNHNVLVALDLGSERTVKEHLNRNVLRIASEWSHDPAQSLHIGYALRYSKLLEEMGLINLERVIDDALSRREIHLNWLQSTGIASEHIHVVPGEPTQVLSQLAQEHQIETLVIGSIGRDHQSGTMIGNTAEALLTQLDCNLLVVPSQR